MNLIIDIGNSRHKYAVFEGDNMITSTSEQKDDGPTLKSILDDHKIKNCIISSVTKEHQPLLKILAHLSHNNTILLEHNTPIPLINRYKTKKTLGYDRIASAVGGNYLYPSTNLLIIDAGTAITIDFINAKNEYLGGNISPGISMRFDALHHFTSGLPKLEKNEQITLFGDTTTQAIINGVENGIIYEIDGYINQFKSSYENLTVIVTGGDSDFFDKTLKNTIFALSNLTMIGLNRILNYNVENK